MPELPEVETIRQDLAKKILNKKIAKVAVYRASSAWPSPEKFIKTLNGNTITKIERRGKLLIWSLKKGKEKLLVHLKMTGQLIYEKEIKRDKVEIVAGGHKLSEKDLENLPNSFTRIVLVFGDGSELFFNDLRVFGYMKLADAKAVERVLAQFGPEPIRMGSPRAISTHSRLAQSKVEGRAKSRGEPFGKNFTLKYFSSLFRKNSTAPIKALLLDQTKIAGIGNIYADEVCFSAKVKPNRRVGTITKQEQKKLFMCIPKILREAIKHRGTTFRNFLDASGKKGNYTDFLCVYDRKGEPCRVCKEPIKKIRAAGRGTHFCSFCQK